MNNKEEDPNGIDQHAPGAKLDLGKADASLLLMFGRALIAVADVGTFGARKYTRGGWQHVDGGINRYTAALLRHLFAENQERNDRDSGLAHAAHAAWNALARLELMLREEENKNNAEQEQGNHCDPVSAWSADAVGQSYGQLDWIGVSDGQHTLGAATSFAERASVRRDVVRFPGL